MKLIIQIPCYNEAETLPGTLRDIPKSFRGVDTAEVLVIDDGSTDNTADVARAGGVHHIVKLTHNMGLAESFSAGIDACLRLGADVIVNTDGDNQYHGADIQKLIDPIIKGDADVVIGDRQVSDIAHFSFAKKRLQKLGSWVVRQLSGTTVPDTTSGFRAYSRDAALRMNVISKFTYTLETVIQAGKKKMAIGHVPVRTNRPTRSSRLFKSIPGYMKRSMATILRIYTLYEPLKMFWVVGSIVFGTGLIVALRYLYFHFTHQGGHIQSLILSAVLMIVGFQTAMIGLLADIIGANRRLIEDTLYRVKKIELNQEK
ncbi:glycosyltransferase family 2 protein [bacterium]|nr:glycosyltransferase family 2 protein [bacterium]